jgi:DEAD/DEAH box helicase domain-containing protein
MKLIVFDVETKKTFDEVGGYHPAKLEVSVSGVFYRDSETGDEWIRGYREEEFPEMFSLFEQADRIVGFNSINFDMPALQPYYVGDLLALPNFDIMVEIQNEVGHRIGLDAVAKETIGAQKSGHGLDAIKYYREGDWENLTKYCLKDVEITRDIYDYGVKYSQLKFKNKWNNLIEVPVQFEEREVKKAKVQTTLF